MKFTLFDAVKQKIDDDQLVTNIEKSIKKHNNQSKTIWFEPTKTEGTEQNILNYYRHQQKKEFDIEQI